jgi:hypothetical protein
VGQLREIHAKDAAAGRDALEAALPPVPLSHDRRPTEELLVSAETYLGIGESIDTVCQVIEPRYRDWSSSDKLAFRRSLRAALEERRARSAEQNDAAES